jgi:hypothetical protein
VSDVQGIHEFWRASKVHRAAERSFPDRLPLHRRRNLEDLKTQGADVRAARYRASDRFAESAKE